MCFSPIRPMLGEAADKYPRAGKPEFLEFVGMGANADEIL